MGNRWAKPGRTVAQLAQLPSEAQLLNDVRLLPSEARLRSEAQLLTDHRSLEAEGEDEDDDADASRSATGVFSEMGHGLTCSR